MDGNNEVGNNEGNLNEGEIEYTVEMDVPNINHILNMYHVGSTSLGTNNTSNVTPVPFSSTNINYQCPVDNFSQLYDNIEPLYISEVKDMKNNIIDILNNRSDFVNDDYDDKKYKSEEIDKLYETIKGINEEFKILQEKLYIAEEKLKSEINTLNSNIKKLDSFIIFLESLSSIEYCDIEVIIKNINELSSKLSNVESFKKAKKEYTTERKNILKYIYLMRKVNKMNVTNMCVVCMDTPVTHFINPCGHTFCSGCLENHLGIEDITNDNTIYNGKKCPICRKYVNTINPLYFL